VIGQDVEVNRLTAEWALHQALGTIRDVVTQVLEFNHFGASVVGTSVEFKRTLSNTAVRK
jgi:hypothetical protein